MKGYTMTITKIEAGEYKVCEATLIWNEWETYTGEIRIYNYPSDGCFGNWGVVFEYTDKYGNECISNTERCEFFYTLAEAKDYFNNGGAVETWGDAGYGRICLTQI